MAMARSKTAVATVAPTTATRTAGIVRVKRGSTSRTANVIKPSTNAVELRSSNPLEERPHLVDEAVGVGREPAQLGQLADDDGDRQPVHVADLDLLREQIGDEAELRDPEPDQDQPDHDRHHPGERDGRLRIACDGERHDGGEDQRRHRRVRPEHEHARRTHQRIPDEAGNGRVEPGHRRQAGQLGVGHALRYQDRRQHHPGHEIGAQPHALVAAERPDAGHLAPRAETTRRARIGRSARQISAMTGKSPEAMAATTAAWSFLLRRA